MVPGKNSCLCRFCAYHQLDGLVQNKIGLHKTHCSTWAGFWIQSVLSILLSRPTNSKEWCFPHKQRQHALKDSLLENYELSFRLRSESHSTGKEHVYCIGFYGISYIQELIRSWHTWPAQKETTSCTSVYVQDQHWIGYILNSNSAVCPLAQARDTAWQEEEEEHADHNLRRVTIKRRKKGLRCSTKMDFMRLRTDSYLAWMHVYLARTSKETYMNPGMFGLSNTSTYIGMQWWCGDDVVDLPPHISMRCWAQHLRPDSTVWPCHT